MLGDWHVYALGGVALTGFLLLQAALQTGALAPAMTSETVLEALAGVVVGIFVLNERLDQSPAETVVSLLGLALVVAGLFAWPAAAEPSDGVHHPDVRLPVASGVPLSVDLERSQPAAGRRTRRSRETPSPSTPPTRRPCP